MSSAVSNSSTRHYGRHRPFHQSADADRAADSQGGAFDYGALDAEKAQALRNAAHAIRIFSRSAIYDLGRHLLDAKKLLEHGEFLRCAPANSE